MKKGILLLTAAIAGLLFVSSCKDKEEMTHFQIGEKLPAFSVSTLDGKKVSTEDLKGMPSVLIIFTTTCPDCHAQLPEIEILYGSHKGEINVLAVNRGEDKSAVSAFWQERSFNIPVAAPGDRSIYDLFDRGSQTGVPQVYISDPQGTIIGFADDTKVITADEIVRICQD